MTDEGDEWEWETARSDAVQYLAECGTVEMDVPMGSGRDRRLSNHQRGIEHPLAR